MRKYNSENMIALIRKHIFEQHQNSQSQYAEYLGISDAYVSQILRGERPIITHMLLDIGFKRVVPEEYYVKLK